MTSTSLGGSGVCECTLDSLERLKPRGDDIDNGDGTMAIPAASGVRATMGCALGEGSRDDAALMLLRAIDLSTHHAPHTQDVSVTSIIQREQSPALHGHTNNALGGAAAKVTTH